ncbi:hypothetical protein P2318_27840 [Myxococcaceae bacterium GXIMD 01537]
MNLASLVNPSKTSAHRPAPQGLALLRVQATVLAHGLLGAARDGVHAFRAMRSVLTQGVLTAP